jgi:hypothetical protein
MISVRLIILYDENIPIYLSFCGVVAEVCWGAKALAEMFGWMRNARGC